MLVTCMMHSLEANNKLINGKGNWEPRMKEAGAGENRLGFYKCNLCDTLI